MLAYTVSDATLIGHLCGMAALVLTLIFGFRLMWSFGRVRKESKRGFQVAERIEADYMERRARDEEERKALTERFESLDQEVRERVAHSDAVANSARDRLEKLEKYLKEFFEVELTAVFESFDKTVASILEEMKAELLRGVDRIEEIQAVVDSKSLAQERILEGDGSVYRMIAETADEPSAASIPEPDAAPAPAPEMSDAGFSIEADESDPSASEPDDEEERP
jgi:uncharacterized membrane protein